MASFFKHADVLLISLLNRDVFNKTIPGKIQFYLSSGLPIIGMISGEGADVIKKANAGIVCESGDYKSFCQIVEKIITLNKKSLHEMGANGKRFANKEFSKNKLINKLEKLLEDLKNKNKI